MLELLDIGEMCVDQIFVSLCSVNSLNPLFFDVEELLEVIFTPSVSLFHHNDDLAILEGFVDLQMLEILNIFIEEFLNLVLCLLKIELCPFGVDRLHFIRRLALLKHGLLRGADVSALGPRVLHV